MSKNDAASDGEVERALAGNERLLSAHGIAGVFDGGRWPCREHRKVVPRGVDQEIFDMVTFPFISKSAVALHRHIAKGAVVALR
jgi:hypothetical protein